MLMQDFEKPYFDPIVGKTPKSYIWCKYIAKNKLKCLKNSTIILSL